MSGRGGGVSWGDFIIIVFIIAALGGGGFKGCEAASGSGDTPKPRQSAVCNEYFKGGC